MTNFTRAALLLLSVTSACATTRTTVNNSNTASTPRATTTAQPAATASNGTAVRVLGDVPDDATLAARGVTAAPVAGTIGQLQLGGVVRGALAAGDTVLTDGSYADNYALSLTEGQPVTIVVRGGARSDINETMDMYSALFLGDAEIEHNDDITAENRDSRIVYTPTRTAVYRLVVTTFGSGAKPGAYEVVVAAGANPNAT
jgi:hypothetical protein